MEIGSPKIDPGEVKGRQRNPGITSVSLPFHKNRGLQFICLAYGAFWLFLAVEPRNRFDWALENTLVVLSVGILLATHRKYVFSNISYGLLALFLALHALGAHDTYSQTPLGFWIADIFGSERNHFDRIVHFCFGLLLAYPALEVSRDVFGVRSPFRRVLLAFSLLAAASSLYELIEWAAAMVLEPEAALAFLGTQGDVFDAQKDTALAAVGSVIGLGMSALVLKRGGGKEL
jgi:putative membrane protein